MKRFLLVLNLLCLSLILAAQSGTIEGKVISGKTAGPIPSVTIAIEGSKIVKSTNIDGQFLLTLPSDKIYALKLSAIGYNSKIIDSVVVDLGKVTYLTISLDLSTKKEEGIVIRSSSKKESVASLIAVQKNTSVVAQVISAEAIRRSPDKNTGEILKRVPGLSLQEGKYIIVRGLADRYNQAMLNGVLLSSTEPDRKTFSFDIFPSGMIENIIINKAFVPELPGEWAGGLIQVNTKDVPAKNFFTVQIGTGFNTATTGKEFYTYKGGNTDFLGFDNGLRGLPAGLPTKSNFKNLDINTQNEFAKQFSNIWTADKTTPQLDKTLQLSGGVNKGLGGSNKLAAVLALNYRNVNRLADFDNQIATGSTVGNVDATYSNKKYAKEVLAGALANITLQLGNNNKISFKNILNVTTSNYATLRTGQDATTFDNIKATELAFKANTFFNTQLTGDHNITKLKTKLHWFGSFNILDQYIPDQRRIQYVQQISTPNAPFTLQQATNSSQKSGSRYFGSLNDYNYTTGIDIAKSFTINKITQTIKGGYFFQVKDRLFDARPFAYYVAKPVVNNPLFSLPQNEVYVPQNFGTEPGQFNIAQLSNPNFRYIANSILNAGFIQLDNQFLKKFRAVWGLRVEDFDQLVGSAVKSDPRFLNTRVTDFLPGVNITYKATPKTNIRLSGSQTIIRPEFRELSNFQFYDFDLSATVQGNPKLERTKVTNADLRYEIYPRSGELLTFGLFYKKFKNPIESYANQSSFTYLNAEKATSYGAEFEIRKKLDFVPELKNFTAQTNFAYIYNRVSSDLISDLDRPMQGQSPYLINATLQYDIEKYGITSTLLFNKIGRRINLVGGTGQAPVWENSRSVLDLQIAKKVMKTKGEIKLNVSDIFNQRAIFYYKETNGNYEEGKDAYFRIIKFGTNFSISYNYNF